MSQRAVRALVIWFGVFQAIHAVFGAKYVLVERRFMVASADHVPFPEPKGGWQPQAVDVIAAMGAVDLVISVLSVVFAVGYLRGAPLAGWLGVVCLTVSVYAGLVFNWGTLASGAWSGSGNLTGYLVINIPWLPNVVLFAMVAIAGARGVSLFEGGLSARQAKPALRPAATGDRSIEGEPGAQPEPAISPVAATGRPSFDRSSPDR